MLVNIFPRAKFVHIYRNPYTVYVSNANMARTTHYGFQLQDPPSPPVAKDYPARFLDYYVAMEEHFYAQAARLPANQVAEVRFEDLEINAVQEIERIFRNLDMTISPEYRGRLQRYLESIANYKKNTFEPLPHQQRIGVREKLAPLFERWGYATS